MMEQVFSTADKLSGVIRNMQKCLQCIICLHTISEPVKTRCGHRFCRECIQPLLQNTNATCPLCNSILQRRSISKDEHMEIYIDKLENLIAGIQMDSGIDISLYAARVFNTAGSCSSDRTEYCKSDQDGQVVPSYSNLDVKPTKRYSSLKSNFNAKSKKTSKKKKQNRNDITKHINKYGLSGVQLLSLEESSSYQREAGTEIKVQNWLQTLPENNALNDPDRFALVQSTEDLEDTLPYPVPETLENNKVDNLGKDAAALGGFGRLVGDESNTRDSKQRRVSKDSSHGESSKNEASRSRERRGSLNTRSHGSKSSERRSKPQQVDSIRDDQKPSTSGVFRTRDNEGMDNAYDPERPSDVHRTSPGDMLPAMKKNWSCVVQFGKEMRTKRKKLKSLNVSIESKNKSRSCEESIKERAPNSRAIKNTENGRKETGANTSESVASARVDKHRLEKRLPNIESAWVREQSLEEPSLRNKSDRSMSGGLQLAGESSFITLEEGKQVHIRNLNSYQMNDIIGVGNANENLGEAEIENLKDNRSFKGNARFSEKRASSSRVQDQSESALQATPRKRTIERSLRRTSQVNESSNRNASPVLTNICTPLIRAERVDEITNSALKILSLETSQTPNRNRLSLKRQSTDRKSNEFENVDSVSRLLAVKRDLNRQIDQNEKGDGSSELAVGSKKKSKAREESRDLKDTSVAFKCSKASNGILSNKNENTGQTRQLVTFKKLGKVFKSSLKKPVTFLYLGSTRRKLSSNRNSTLMKLVKPFNPVESEEPCVQTSTASNSFGNNSRISLNDAKEQNEVEDNSSKKAEGALEAGKGQIVQPELVTTSCINMYKENKSKQNTSATVSNKPLESEDVLYVSLYENEENNEQGAMKLPVFMNTASKDTVRLLSPGKDSQLKFLSLESPTTGSLKICKTDASENKTKRHNFSDVRGAHSRSLITESQQASKESKPEPSSSPRKKRKRSNSNEKLAHRMKKKSNDEKENSIEEDKSDSDHSFSSKVTRVRHPNFCSKEVVEVPGKDDNKSKRYHSVSSNRSGKETVLLTSDTDTENLKATVKGGKKVYKKIILVGSSGTDSSEVIWLNAEKTNVNDRTTVSPTSKRKRAASSGSDDDTDVDAIVNSWYKDLIPADGCTKKGKVDETLASSDLKQKEIATNFHKASRFPSESKVSNKQLVSQRRHLIELDVPSNSETPSSQGTKRLETLGNKEALDNDSPDFGAIINKIRDIQNTMVASTPKDSSAKQKGVKEPCLMQDNFDEIIANVDTDALLSEYTETKRKCESVERLSRNENNKVPEPGKSAVLHFRSVNKDGPTPHHSNGSDKESRHKSVAKVYHSDERTLEYINVDTRKCRGDSSQNDTLLERLRPFESTSKESLRKSSVSNRTSVHNSAENDKPAERVVNDAAEETCYDQDSLMNITQHYLMIKQFEDDLFGKPQNLNVPSEKGRREMEHQTPQKMRKVNVERVKDAEHSGEEDDIVENTPDIKTRDASPKRNSTPVSSINGKQLSISPLSLAGRSSSTNVSPECKRVVHPFYQSTPKERMLAKSNYVAGACTEKKELDPSASTTESSSKQTKGVAEKSVQSRQRFCFVCSGLTASEIENVKRLAHVLKARYVTQFDQEVTHVIVKVKENNNGANKTLKYLQGVAHRKWVVGYHWVIDSLTEKRLVNEETYEAVDCSTLEAGPQKSRLREKGLFEGFVFLCKGPYVDISVEQCQELLRATGATVVDSLEALAFERQRLKIIVIQADIHDDKIIVEWYRKTHAVSIVYDWVVECISQYKLISFYQYLQELSRQDVRKLGYPEFLLEEYPDEDSDSDASM